MVAGRIGVVGLAAVDEKRRCIETNHKELSIERIVLRNTLGDMRMFFLSPCHSGCYPHSMKLSIALCTYNGQPYLQAQLASYLTQTRLADQLVVCDDGSTDGSLQVLEEFARTAPFEVRIHRNKANLGFAKNFEQAIQLCDKDLIFYSDQDDIWLPKKLERMAAVIEHDPNCGGVLCDAEVVDSTMKPKGYTVWQSLGFTPHLQQRVREAGADAFTAFTTRDFVAGHSLAFRALYKPLLVPFPGRFIFDWWTAMLIATVGKIVVIPEVFVKYRQHSRNSSGGVTAATSTRDAFLRTVVDKRRKNTRTSGLTMKATRLECVNERLLQQERFSPSSVTLRVLQHQIQHLKRRAAMPSNRLYRGPAVIREALALGYHNYGRGTRDILKDLLERDLAL
jgi:hypothetical protein